MNKAFPRYEVVVFNSVQGAVKMCEHTNPPCTVIVVISQFAISPFNTVEERKH